MRTAASFGLDWRNFRGVGGWERERKGKERWMRRGSGEDRCLRRGLSGGRIVFCLRRMLRRRVEIQAGRRERCLRTADYIAVYTKASRARFRLNSSIMSCRRIVS